MLSKLLVWTVLAIFLGKFVFRRQFKGLGAQVDRFVNATIVAFLLAYVILAVVECQGRKKGAPQTQLRPRSTQGSAVRDMSGDNNHWQRRMSDG